MAYATGMGDIENMNVRGYITNNVMDWCKNVQDMAASVKKTFMGIWRPNVAANAKQKKQFLAG